MPEYDPLKRFGGKKSADWRYFAQDFMEHRQPHWMSIYYQCSVAAQRPDITSVLEFGGGRDVTRTLMRHIGLDYTSVDALDRFYPDVLSTINDFPLDGKTYDMVCSFQCLEHNPYENVPDMLKHMARFSSKYVYISVPYSGAWFGLSWTLRIPFRSWSKTVSFTADGLGGRAIDSRLFHQLPKETQFAKHWWEVGRPGLPKKRFIQMAETAMDMRLIDMMHNPHMPHHLFLLFSRP